MEAINDFTIQNTKKRPDFLTVICILSFVGCGLMFLAGIYSMIHNTPENMAKSIEQIREFKPEMADQMEQNMLAMQDSTYIKISPYLNIAYLLISFLGIMMMWRLSKKGFYVYLAGELLPYIPMVFMRKETMAMMGAAGGGFMQTMITATIAMMVIFDIVFIAMYAMNLKHMKQ